MGSTRALDRTDDPRVGREFTRAVAGNRMLNASWNWLFFKARRPRWALAEIALLELSTVISPAGLGGWPRPPSGCSCRMPGGSGSRARSTARSSDSTRRPDMSTWELWGDGPDAGHRGAAGGLRYVHDFISVDEEESLLDRLRSLDCGEVRMHGQVARRVARHYGFGYAFDSARLTPSDPVPGWLLGVRERCARLLVREPQDLAEGLATRHPPGATIGWHRDAPAFGEVVGVLLAAPCVMRFQRGTGSERRVFEKVLEARSAYVLSGRSRTVWQHSIPAEFDERFSLTFPTVCRGWHP